MNHQKKLFWRNAALLVTVAAIFFAGCTNPANPEPPKYSVTYDGNGNTTGNAPVDATKYAEGTTVTVLANTSLAKPDKAVLGWATTKSAASPEYAPGATFSMPAKDVTLYAVWGPIPTYSISYYANGGTGSAPVDTALYRAESPVTIAGKGKLVYEGKTFLGWATTHTATSAEYVPGKISMPAKNLTLYAVWTDQQCWMIMFDSKGGTAVASQTVTSGSKIIEPTLPTKEGSTFGGWYTSDYYATKWDFTKNTVTETMTLYAKWITPQFKLKYTAGENGTISDGYSQTDSVTQTVNYGLSGYSVTAVANTGYKFVSWSDGITTASRTETNVKANLEVTAKFEKIKYTLTYSADSNGSITGQAAQTVSYGESGTEVTALANAGYHFVRWSDELTSATRAETNVKSNLSLTAIFAKDGTIGIIFSGFADETIDLSQTDDQSLSKTKQDSAIISLGASYDSYEWYEDEDTYASGSGKTYQIKAEYENAGVHNLTVIVTKNGVPYSKQLRYRVVY